KCISLASGHGPITCLLRSRISFKSLSGVVFVFFVKPCRHSAGEAVTSRRLRKEFPQLRAAYRGKPVLWSPSYCIRFAVGAPIEIPKRHVQVQKRPRWSLPPLCALRVDPRLLREAGACCTRSQLVRTAYRLPTRPREHASRDGSAWSLR